MQNGWKSPLKWAHIHFHTEYYWLHWCNCYHLFDSSQAGRKIKRYELNKHIFLNFWAIPHWVVEGPWGFVWCIHSCNKNKATAVQSWGTQSVTHFSDNILIISQDPHTHSPPPGHSLSMRVCVNVCHCFECYFIAAEYQDAKVYVLSIPPSSWECKCHCNKECASAVKGALGLSFKGQKILISPRLH